MAHAHPRSLHTSHQATVLQCQGRSKQQARAVRAVPARPRVPWSARPDASNNAAGWVPDRRPIYLGINSVPLPGNRSATTSAPEVPSGSIIEPGALLNDTGSARSAAIQSCLSEAVSATQLDTRKGAAIAQAPQHPAFEVGGSAATGPTSYERVTSPGLRAGSQVHIRRCGQPPLHRVVVLVLSPCFVCLCGASVTPLDVYP
jgi:hypothetical protein